MNKIKRILFREGEMVDGTSVTRKALEEIASESIGLEVVKGKRWALAAIVDVPEGRRRFTREPIFHSRVGNLPDDHPFASRQVTCFGCGRVVHDGRDGCKATWWETEFGPFCWACFLPGPMIEFLEDATGIARA